MTSDYFKNNDLYDIIFNSYPTKILWDSFLDPKKELDYTDSKYFDKEKRPKAEEYLLSYLIYQFIKNYSLSPSKNREDALKRGIESNKIKINNRDEIISTQEEQAAFLAEDIDYMINNIINNSKEIMIEMFSFILVKKYGYSFDIIQKLINNKFNKIIFERPDFKNFILTMDKNPLNIFYSIYEFLKFVLNQLYIEIKSDYMASSRRKSYLSTQSYIQKFKTKIIEFIYSDILKNYIKPWKEENKTFFDSLPNL
jgi:hypothetical protein